MPIGVIVMSTADDELIESVDEDVEKTLQKSSIASDTQCLFIVAPPTTGRSGGHKTQTQIPVNNGKRYNPTQLHVYVHIHVE